ncbi:polymorphic toxin-type HINT domain-containing protein [Paenibacillus riograndensis]|uniref:polymorphic toxin-type HINT domain-containing protein n=1 Tax=Paenibacillus riograndensis TaxID=483937 RepID=UPI0007642D8E|nr:polymorphic toxin-type HINT domain-containing protein [Paenibacillus riograndensis]
MISDGALVQSDGNTLEITSIELLHKHVTVYNMTVDDFHTYFVSDLGIWVHNSECGVTISKAAARVAKKLSPEAKKGYEAAIMGLETGDLRGLNAHPLSGTRKGQWAVDIKGSGSGRGDARVIYTKDSDGNINVVEVITTHNDY